MRLASVEGEFAVDNCDHISGLDRFIGRERETLGEIGAGGV